MFRTSALMRREVSRKRGVSGVSQRTATFLPSSPMGIMQGLQGLYPLTYSMFFFSNSSEGSMTLR